MADDNGPGNDFGGTGVGWPADVGRSPQVKIGPELSAALNGGNMGVPETIQSDGRDQFAAVAQPERSPVTEILSRANSGPISTSARDVNRAHEIYHNARAAGEEHEAAIDYGIQAINAYYDGDYDRLPQSYPFYPFTHEAISAKVETFDPTERVA